MDYANVTGNMSEQSSRPWAISVVTGSSRNFRGIPEPCDFNPTRPLMVSTWTQTTDNDFSVLLLEDQKLQREAKLKLIGETACSYSNLFTQTLASISQAAALLDQQPLQPQEPNSIALANNIANTSVNSRHQVSCYPDDCIHCSKPVADHFPTNDGALNLDSSVNLGHSEFYLDADESMEFNSEWPAPAPATNHATGQEQKSTIRNYQGNQINCSMHTSSIPIQNMWASDENGIYLTSQNSRYNGCEVIVNLDNVFVSLGPNNTRVPAKLYNNINWSSTSISTRTLLMATFDRNILATHSASGELFPTLDGRGKPVKRLLTPSIISDVIFTVTRRCNVSSEEVLDAIATKCADDNHIMKLQNIKRRARTKISRENM